MRKSKTLLLGMAVFALSLASSANMFGQELDQAPVVPSDTSVVDDSLILGDDSLALADEPFLLQDGGAQSGPPQLPIHLPQPGFLQELGIGMAGWVQGGYTGNGYSPADRWNGPVFLNDRSDDFQMNQLWLAFDKVADNGGCGLALGGHMDIVYGTDWRYGAAYGLENKINSPDTLYGLVLPQMYGEVALNKLKIKGGRYASNYGHELVPSPANFFYSHTLAMALEPLLVTGIKADYQLNDRWGVSLGTHRGLGMFEDWNNDWDIVAGATWTPAEGTVVRYNMDTGRNKPSGTPFADHGRFGQYIVWDQAINPCWDYSMQYTFIYDDNGIAPSGADAQVHSLAHWLIYKASDKWHFGGRFEWMSDANGYGVNGIGNWLAAIDGGAAPTAGWKGVGYQGDFYNFTLGANYRPCPNMVIRPEIRWDFYEGQTNGAGDYPFNDGTRNNQTTFGIDFVFLY